MNAQHGAPHGDPHGEPHPENRSAPAHHEPDLHAIDHHLRDYKKIITILSIATAIEFLISWLMAEHHMGFVMGVVVLVALAFFKATLVARSFMHLKYDSKPLSVIAMTPLLLASFLIIVGVFDGIKGPNI